MREIRRRHEKQVKSSSECSSRREPRLIAAGSHIDSPYGEDPTLREVEIRHVRLLGQRTDRPKALAFDNGVTVRYVPDAEGVGVDVRAVGRQAREPHGADAERPTRDLPHRSQDRARAPRRRDSTDILASWASLWRTRALARSLYLPDQVRSSVATAGSFGSKICRGCAEPAGLA